MFTCTLSIAPMALGSCVNWLWVQNIPLSTTGLSILICYLGIVHGVTSTLVHGLASCRPPPLTQWLTKTRIDFWPQRPVFVLVSHVHVPRGLYSQKPQLLESARHYTLDDREHESILSRVLLSCSAVAAVAGKSQRCWRRRR